MIYEEYTKCAKYSCEKFASFASLLVTRHCYLHCSSMSWTVSVKNLLFFCYSIT